MVNFVLYSSENLDIVKENTGVLLVDDKINTIQTLATDKMVITEAGFLEIFVNNDAQTPVYFDNLRVVQSVSTVKEVNAYYPFGMLIGALSFQAAGDEYNAYKYNQKELQTEMNLNWGDHGARMADYTVGRWWVPDPLAEFDFGISPYSYCWNNPINFVDPTGLRGLASSFVDPSGKIIETRDDGDCNVYFVHDPDNWDRTKDGLLIIGQTPEPNTLGPYVGQNIRSENIINHLDSEAKRTGKDYELSWNAIANLENLAQLKKDLAEQISLLKQLRALNKDQLSLQKKILKNKEKQLNEYKRRNSKHEKWFLPRVLVRTLVALCPILYIDDKVLNDALFPESILYDIDQKYDLTEKEILEKYK